MTCKEIEKENSITSRRATTTKLIFSLEYKNILIIAKQTEKVETFTVYSGLTVGISKCPGGN